MDTAQKLHDIFYGSSRAHGSFIVNNTSVGQKKQGTAKTIKTMGSSVKHWKDHIDGVRGLGVVPIDEENHVKWGAIDIDTYSLDIKKLVLKIEEFKLPLVVCRSKSGGAHVYCFLKDKAPAGDMQDKLREISAGLGYGGVEIFPKQREVLVDRGDIGSWLNMPYFEGDESLRYAYDSKGDALTVSEFIEFVEKRSLDYEKLIDLEVPTLDDIKDGPPCLQILCKEGFPEGTRNNGLYNIGVYLKKANPDTWQTDLATYNTKFMKPPLSPQQVMTTISSLNKKDYQYKCKDQPICNYCDSLTCQTRKFGIGNGTLMPDISNLRKFTSDPPRWFVNVGGETVDVKTNELRTFDLFDEACMDQISIKLPNVSKPIWGKVISNLMKAVEEIEAPETLKYKKQLEEHLENFTTDRAAGKQKTDINRGVSWTDEGRTYFKFKDFWKYLQNTRTWDMERNKTLTKIGEYFDANIKDQISIASKDVKVVSLKAFSTSKEKDEPPKLERPPFVK